MKKQIKFLLVILSFFLVLGPAWAEKTEKVAVFPVNILIKNGSYGLYPNILNLISADLVNTLDKNSVASVIDLQSTENIIKAAGLTKKYQKFLLEYQTSSTIDYDTCALLAQKLGVSKIILVSGGFDMQRMLLARDKKLLNDLYDTFYPILNMGLFPFCFFDDRANTPRYRLDVMLTLIDPQTGQIIWGETYKKNFQVKDFTLATQNYSENIVSLEKIKKFSNKLAKKASAKMDKIFNTVTTNVHSDIAPKTEIPEETTTDGVMTKDGHFSSSEDYPLTKRKDDYKEWVKEKVQNQ